MSVRSHKKICFVHSSVPIGFTAELHVFPSFGAFPLRQIGGGEDRGQSEIQVRNSYQVSETELLTISIHNITIFKVVTIYRNSKLDDETYK